MFLNNIVEQDQLNNVDQLEDKAKCDLLLPASYNQQWLWFLDSLTNTSWYYNMPLALKVKGPLNLAAFREAIAAMVRRHESLRTVFRNRNGTVYRLILEEYELPFSVINAEQFLEEEIKQEVAREAKIHFLLNGNELLFKVCILEFDKENHLILLTMHHTVFDGWSYDIFFADLADFYAHYCHGKPSQLSPLRISYSDYVRWQIQLLNNKDVDKKLNFWKNLLKDVPLLQFPTDYSRPNFQTFDGKYIPFELDAALVKNLYQFAKETHTSPFIVSLSVFYVLLCRYANQTDFAFGVPLSGRHGLAKMEKIIGYFTNIIAFRIKSDTSLTFNTLLAQIKSLIFEIYEYQDIPFGKVIESLTVKRDLSRNPLFQILFAYQNVGINKLSIPDLVIENYREGYDAARFDFTFEIEDRVNTLRGGVYYNVSLFSENTIRDIIESFKEILRSVIHNADIKLAEIPLFNQSARDLLLEQHCYTPTKSLVRDFFEKQVQKYPLNTAIKYKEEYIHYADLDRKVNQLVNFLQNQEVVKGTKIGIGTGRSIELIVSVVACFKAGFIYVPLEVEYPIERLKYIIKDAGISVILTQTAWLHLFKDIEIEVIDLKSEKIYIEKSSSILQPIKLAPEDPAYIFYTSGTTGLPKGSLISHANISNLLESTRSLFDFNSEDKILLFHSYAFDVALWEIFSTFCFGSTLVILDKDDILSMKRFYELLVNEKITVLNETPSAFEQLLFYEQTYGSRKLSLRYVILAGEALKPKMLQPWFTYYPERVCKIINMYGITETTIYSTYLLINETMTQGAIRSSIGKALPGVALYILDEHQQLLPPNVMGEIYIAGYGVGQGYLNLPELTKKKFLPDMFSQLNKKMYRTGDIGRCLQNGEIEYLGRADNQVKIRGYRVELEEIEFIILSHPQVREVLVHLQKDELYEYNNRLIAYVIPKGGIQKETLQKELEFLLENKLPHYMKVQIAFLEKFPMLVNHKIDKSQLPKIPYVSPKIIAAGPSSDTEVLIAKMWQEILNVEVNNIDINFFDMGGNSLFAMQLHSRLNEKFALNLKIIDLFNYTNIRKLSEYIDKKLRN